MRLGSGLGHRCLQVQLHQRRVAVTSYEKSDVKNWLWNTNPNGISADGGCNTTKAGMGSGGRTEIEMPLVTIHVTVSAGFILSFQTVAGNIFSMHGSNG